MQVRNLGWALTVGYCTMKTILTALGREKVLLLLERDS